MLCVWLCVWECVYGMHVCVFTCLWVHIYVHICSCASHVCMRVQSRGDDGCLPQLLSIYLLRQDLLFEPRAHLFHTLASQLALRIPCLCLSSYGVSSRPPYQSVTYHEIWTQFFIIARQVFYTVSNLPKAFFWWFCSFTFVFVFNSSFSFERTYDGSFPLAV